MSAELLLANWS